MVTPLRRTWQQRVADDYIWPWAVDDLADLPALPLLADPLSFSQTGLLSPSRFRREAAARGSVLEDGQLEELHRRRLLVPLYRVVDRPDSRHMVKIQADLTWLWHVRVPASRGRVRDVARMAFRPWGRSGAGAIFYSRYQLLGLRSLERFVRRMRVRREDDDLVFSLRPVGARTRATAEAGRRLAVLLEVLDPYYRPQVDGVLKGDLTAWRDGVRAFTPTEFLRRCGTAPDVIFSQAEHLLHQADSFDPLARWLPIVANARQRGWEQLADAALLALDYRVAAEILLRASEDLASAGLGPPVPACTTIAWQPIRGRLTRNRTELDETLMRFGLSTHPSIVVGLEGKTEMTIFPKVVELLGYEVGGFIETVDLQGVGGDTGVLVRYAGAPRLGDVRQGGVEVTRPLAHIAIVSDAEGKKRSTLKDLVRLRRRLIDDLLQALPPQLRTDAMRGSLRYLVSVNTWGHLPYEFAHFTDEELADGVIALRSRAAGSRTQLVAALARQRGSPAPNPADAWKRIAGDVSKVQLAEQLWPLLEGRCLVALAGTGADPPILAVARKVIEKGNLARRATVLAV